jgi:hypothetical protein
MGGAPIAGGPTGRAPKAGPLGPGGRTPGRPFAVWVGNPASNYIGSFGLVSNGKMQPGILCSLFNCAWKTKFGAMTCRPEVKCSAHC